MGDNEIPYELKNDIKIAFDLYKDENNKINKLKLRTLLFSFIMFNCAASEINQYIEETISPNQEFFTLEDLYTLIKEKLNEAKSKEAEELLNFVTGNDSSEVVKESDLRKAFQKHKIEINDKEIKEMFSYIKGNNDSFNNLNKKDNYVSSSKFMDFYIDN